MKKELLKEQLKRLLKNEKTSEKFILNMYKKGYTLDQIADVAETGVDEVEAIIKKKEPAMA